MADQVLFKFKEYVQLWKTNGGVPNINGPMIQYNAKIYKGATNTIDFVVRNNDRKSVNLVGYQITALIQRVESPEILLEKTVNPTDETDGKAQLVLDQYDIQDWYGGFYRYSIRLTDVNSRQEFLYTDINRSTTGTFELIEGMSVSISPPVQILNSQFVPAGAGYDQTTTYWTTGAITGNAQNMKASGLNTLAVYTTNFIGQFWVQASIMSSTPTDMDWSTVQLTQDSSIFYYTVNLSSLKIQSFTFAGNYYWVRFLYKPDRINTGTLDKILYKN
jgi:hypothetical protein